MTNEWKVKKLQSKAEGRRRQWGQGMTEFALALPIFLILLLGVIEMGHLLYMYSSVYAGAREAARYGASVSDEDTPIYRFADCDGIRNQARRIAFLSNLEDDQIVIEFDNPDYPSLPRRDCSYIAAHTGLVGLEQNKYNRVTVTVNTSYRPLIPIVDIPAMPVQTSVGRTIIRNLYFRNYVNQQIPNNNNPPNPPNNQCPQIVSRTANTNSKTVEYSIDNPSNDEMIIESLTIFWLKDNNNQQFSNLSLFPAGGTGPELIWQGPDTTQYTNIPNDNPSNGELTEWRIIDSNVPADDPVNTGIRTLPPHSVGNQLIAQFDKLPALSPGITLEISFNHDCIGINDKDVP